MPNSSPAGKLENVVCYDVISDRVYCVTVNENNVWCDPLGSPLADQTRYSRVIPKVAQGDYLKSIIITMIATASFMGLILFAAWFAAHFISK